MAITRPTSGWSYDDVSVAQNPYLNPYGGSAVSSNTSYNEQTQYNIYNLPDRLRGMRIEDSLKTIDYRVAEYIYQDSHTDPNWRDAIKRQMSAQMAEVVMKTAVFTQASDPIMGQIKIIGRVVIMTEDQLNKLIQRVR